ncbi:hypothetical protein [Streptomyces sp. DW26H14]|uniref:hypothetical protein n=1 Tax=Streptomyces sp. DW26H14 TaxID=3435395 RepID=UPI00403DDBCD
MQHIEPVITSEIANHVLWHYGQGGHPAGSFTTGLLTLWGRADDTNSARLASQWPDYAAAIELAERADGIAELQHIAGQAAA